MKLITREKELENLHTLTHIGEESRHILRKGPNEAYIKNLKVLIFLLD